MNDLPLTQEEYVALLNTMTSGGTGPHPVNVYKRAASAPDTPTGDGTPTGWSVSPPAADGNPLWLSTSIQTALNTLIGSWSAPVQLTGTAGTDGEDGVDGTDGGYIDYVFQRAATQPDAPTGSDTPPDGWYDAPPEADGNPLWMTTAYRLADDTVVGLWSTPVQIDGESIYIQYSTNNTDWHDPPFTEGDLYMRTKLGVDGTWSTGFRIVGEKGDPGDVGLGYYEGDDADKSGVTPDAPGAFYRATDTDILYAWDGEDWQYAATKQMAALIGFLSVDQIYAKSITGPCIDTIEARSVLVGASDSVQHQNTAILGMSMNEQPVAKISGILITDKMNCVSFRVKAYVAATNNSSTLVVTVRIKINNVQYGSDITASEAGWVSWDVALNPAANCQVDLYAGFYGDIGLGDNASVEDLTIGYDSTAPSTVTRAATNNYP